MLASFLGKPKTLLLVLLPIIQSITSQAAVRGYKSFEEIPGPKGLPVIGVLHKYLPYGRWLLNHQLCPVVHKNMWLQSSACLRRQLLFGIVVMTSFEIISHGKLIYICVSYYLFRGCRLLWHISSTRDIPRCILDTISHMTNKVEAKLQII